MKSFIETNTIITKDKKIYANVKILNRDNSDNISSNKYNKLLEDLNEEVENGRLVLAEVFNDKPARLIQWVKSSENILFEIFHSRDNKEWKFSHEYTLTYDDLQNFSPIYEYSSNIVDAIKKEQADKELTGTTFLTRD